MAEKMETVLVQLSDEERDERAYGLAEVSHKILTLEAQRKASTKNDQIAELKREQRDLIEAVNSGKERRPAQLDLVAAG